MIIVKGKYNEAKIFTNNPDEQTEKQVLELCNQEFVKGEKIRVMPDCHVGIGCTIGTTMTITDKIVPNLVGVDIGCGVIVAFIPLHKDEINFEQLDEVIRKKVPSGFNVHSRSNRHPFVSKINFDDIYAPVDLERAKNSVGTLGGGNHFIELNEVSDDSVALVIHSGSRNLGKQIAEYYQNLAYDELTDLSLQKERLMKRLKEEGKEEAFEEEFKKITNRKINKNLAYLQGDSFKRYMNDMKIAQKYADINRKAMVDIIVKNMGWKVVDSFTTIHNYIDMDDMIMRKGAISAQQGERLIIPINMRDGSLIAIGKGNPDWNYSGPHGAGRLLSRRAARQQVSMKEFEESMKNVWTTSVKKSTLDESPFAYKPIEEILKYTKDTIEIKQIIKPIYNFKAS